MPRPKDDDDRDDRPPAKGRPADPAERGPWKELGITFGCVAVAFAAIMIYLTSVAPKGGGPLAGDPPADTDTRPRTPGQPKTDPEGPKPDAWTPSNLTRTPSAMTGRPSFYLKEDANIPAQAVGWVREGVYLQGSTLLAAVTSENKFVGYHVASRSAVAGPADLKAGDGLSNVSATPDETAVFAKGPDRVFRLPPYARQWSSAPLGGSGSCLAVSMDRFLVMEQRFSDTQFRLYRWPPGDATVTLSAKWEVAGSVAAATYDAPSGVLWVVRAKDWNAEAGDLDRFALTGAGGTLLGTVRLPFKVASTSRPVLSPDGKRVYVEDRAVEGDRLLPVGFPGTVVAAVGDFALMNNGEFADATGKVVGKAWDKMSLSAFAFNANQTGCWAYDLSAKTYRWYSVVQGGKLPTDTPTTEPKPPTTEPKPPTTEPKSPVVPKSAPTIKPTELASLPAPDRGLLLFRHSDKHDLLVYSDLSGTTILDTKTGDPLPMPKLDGKLRIRSADFAPDQTALFASDGQNLHRLDLATRKWESRPNVGTRVLAVDGTTALVQVKPSNPATYAVVRWEAGKIAETSRLEWSALYEVGYDAAAKALYVQHAKVNGSKDAVLEKYALKDGAFVSEWTKKATGASVKVTYRPLTTDGKYFFNGSQAWDTTPDDRAVTEYGEPLIGATRTALVASSGKLFAVGNVPVQLGRFPHPVEAVSASADGQTVWVLSRAVKKFIQYKLEPSGKKQ